VLLQEVWVDADAQQLIAAAKAAGLVHATHFRWEGTLSCYPIEAHQTLSCICWEAIRPRHVTGSS